MKWNVYENAIKSSFIKVFSFKKWLLVFVSLVISDVIFSLLYSMAYQKNIWLKWGNLFFPVFVSFFLLLFAGCFLIYCYDKEKNNPTADPRSCLKLSWKFFSRALYYYLPIMLIFIGFWLILGAFFFLKKVPAIGFMMSAFLSIVPFIIFLSFIVLLFVSILMLFYVTPYIALQEPFSFRSYKSVIKKYKKPFLDSLVYFFTAFYLLFIVFLIFAYCMSATLTFMAFEAVSFFIGVQWFILLLFASSIFSFFVLFFFHLAAEGFYLFKQENLRKK